MHKVSQMEEFGFEVCGMLINTPANQRLIWFVACAAAIAGVVVMMLLLFCKHLLSINLKLTLIEGNYISII